jgi:hypothetical protein
MIRLLNVHTLELEDIDEGSNAPPYLILSHRWGKPHEEVSFKDLEDQGSRYFQKKAWKSKVEGFCLLARKHDFDYVWIDTCCIDKSSSSEVSHAIIRMFRWYQKSVACVVYLGDVQQDELPQWDDPYTTIPVWFTRGWTLQELLAPKVVRFYNRNWTFLGTRATLAPQIHRFTGIEEDALHGKDLHTFSFLQRLRWARERVTTRPEDIVYSLLGLFDVVMHPLYGEGETEALDRLTIHNGKMVTPPLDRTTSRDSRSERSHAVAKYVAFLEYLENSSKNRAGAMSASRGKIRPAVSYSIILGHHFPNTGSRRDRRCEPSLDLQHLRPGSGATTIPPGTNRVRIEGDRGISQEISRHSNNAAQRSMPVIGNYNVEGYGGKLGGPLHSPIPRHEALPPPALLFHPNRDIGRQHDRELNHREGLWTEIPKDLVVEEAIQEMGHEFAKTDNSYYIFRDLPDVSNDLQHDRETFLTTK